MRKGRSIAVGILALIFTASLLTALARAQVQPSNSREVKVIVGGTLIDGTGRAPVSDAVIVIEGNTIKAVGVKGKITPPAGARVLDATGEFVLPGFTDCHIHYRDWLGEMLLAHGVTSICDNGNPTDWVLAQRDAIAKGKVIGPRIWASGDQLGTRAPARNPEEALKTVREHIAKGVNKIAMTLPLDPPTMKVIIDEAHKAGIPVSTLSMYPRDAIALGVDLFEHSYTLFFGTKKGAVLEEIHRELLADVGRYDMKWEKYLMDADNDDFIDLLVKHGTYIMPNMIYDFKVIHDRYKEFERESIELATNPNLKYIPVDDWLPQLTSNNEAGRRFDVGLPPFEGEDTEYYKAWKKVYRIQQEFIRKFVKAGGKILVGSDAPNKMLPGLAFHHEMQLLVDAGLTPMEVIVAGTSRPAQFLRQQDRLGTVEAGKLADIVILRANPLQDITNARKIDTVIKDGNVVDTTYHPDFANPIPRPISQESGRNPLPSLTNLLPKVATEGDGDLVLTIQGNDFFKESVAVFDGQRVPTVFVKDTELKATVPARLLQRVGTFPVTVWNPRPFGGTSNDVKFIVKFK